MLPALPAEPAPAASTLASAPPTTPHVALYCRISDDADGLGAGVDRQLRDARAIAATRWPDLPTHAYLDNDQSAYTGRRRPAYTAMTTGITAGLVVAVVAWNQDRLLRLPRELEALIDTCDAAGMRQLVTADGELDLTTHDGQFRARIMAAVAKKSSDDTSRRLKRMLADKIERGEFTGGKLPYGVVRWEGATITEDPRRAAIVREVHARIVRGATLGSAVRWARDADPDGAPAKPDTWRKMMRANPILTARQHADAHAILSDPARNTSTGPERVSWLSGILRCSVCRVPLQRKKGGAIWQCPTKPTARAGGHHVQAVAWSIERAVTVMLLDAGDRVVVHEEVPLPPPTHAALDADTEARLADLAGLYMAGEITRVEWVAGRDAAKAAAVVEPVVPALPRVDDLSARWPGLTVEQRHQAARERLGVVLVKPTAKRGRGGFDPDRLEIVNR